MPFLLKSPNFNAQGTVARYIVGCCSRACRCLAIPYRKWTAIHFFLCLVLSVAKDINHGAMEKLYSYKMSHDDRFAPNPYHGVLTLATCKPRMRHSVGDGNWIAGWTSRSMKTHSTPVGREKLVYLAKVTKKLSYGEYWEAFPNKRPDKTGVAICGDNIYCPDVTQSHDYRLIPNLRHETEKQKTKDMNGKYVLVCEEFYYFGGTKDSTPLEIPVEVRPNVPKGQTSVGYITDNPASFINFVRQNADKCQLCNR